MHFDVVFEANFQCGVNGTSLEQQTILFEYYFLPTTCSITSFVWRSVSAD